MVDMTFEEIAQAATTGALALVPTGCTEQQGPHLPVDFDSWFAEHVTVAAADVLDAENQPVVVLPAIPFGPTPEHRNFGAGFIDIPVNVYDQYVHAVLQSLIDQGFTRIVIWRGCGGHDVGAVVHRVNASQPQVTVQLPALPFHDIWCAIGDPTTPGGHADAFTTSISMALRADKVRTYRIPAGESEQPDWDDPKLDFAEHSKTGVIGSARGASAELGLRLWEACVLAVADTLRSLS